MHIENANLPKNKVSVALIASGYDSIKNGLLGLGITAIEVEPYHKLQKPVSCHADMLVHHLGGKEIFLAKEQDYLYNTLQKIGFLPEYIEEDLKEDYPFDIALNALRLGDKLFCKASHTAKAIQKNIKVIDISQGYSKCSTCVVSEKAIITADLNIAKAAKQNGIDVLVISSGNIKLNGYNYGFIGGCCGLIDKSTLLFTGDISYLSDYQNIMRFTQKHSVKIKCLQGKLVDIGGIIPLIEENS